LIVLLQDHTASAPVSCHGENSEDFLDQADSTGAEGCEVVLVGEGESEELLEERQEDEEEAQVQGISSREKGKKMIPSLSRSSLRNWSISTTELEDSKHRTNQSPVQRI
jgi:hypothetical protein